MINNETKERIVEAARIEEVVGDFVALKKRGSNLLGLCPFHNERTPSFTVSPAKGFFKCFGCGKAGDSVTFIMEHEHLTFPESLRYLANKYNIEIEEEAPSAEQIEAQSVRESLFVVTTFAQKFYSEQLWEGEEGQAIGLTYFRERGFTDEIIRRFQLGYAPDKWDALGTAAEAAGYKQEFLEKTGLTIVQENRRYDRFRGRVIFPILSLTGKVIAFGARILKTDPKSPKYLNSPETEIYHKSKSLYGIAQAKRAITSEDACFLCEGYTDVISMAQAGIENVVASSGTALTVEQIRLIGRYTRNITVLYDGDPAGIKASLRGIDLILEEGMNVRVVLFPDGEDPDSFARKHTTVELREFLKKEAVDFISFKTKLLLSDAAGDPIRRAGLVRDIVETIAKVPDAISRAAYIRQTSVLMEMQEQVLLSELNKILRKVVTQRRDDRPEPPTIDPDGPPVDFFADGADEELTTNDIFDTASQEEEIIRILLNYADHSFRLPLAAAIPGEEPEARVKDFIVAELSSDGIHFINEHYAGLLAEFMAQVEQQTNYEQQQFLQQLSPELRSVAITLLSPQHELSSWDKKGIIVKTDRDQLHKAVIDPVMYIKKKQLNKMRSENQALIKELSAANIDIDELQKKEILLIELQKELNRYTSTIIQR